MALLSDDEIGQRLGKLPDWERQGDVIVKTFELADFVGSVDFVKALVAPAEGMNHHPDVEVSWNKVKVSITNHSQGGLTETDFELAEKIDALG